MTYPFLIEPAFTLGSQAAYWEIGFAVFGLLCGLLAVRAGVIGRLANAVVADGEAGGLTVAPPEPLALAADSGSAEVALPQGKPNGNPEAGDASPGWGRRLLWLVLPAFASLAFLATTNHVCQDVAPIPFLWIAPLSLYLLSFIICFDHERWYIPRIYAVTTLLVFLAGGLWATRATWMPKDASHFDKIQIDAGLSFAGMFLICMLCHGELVRIAARMPRHLTMFYLLIAAGGAVGGLFVSIVAPIVVSIGVHRVEHRLIGRLHFGRGDYCGHRDSSGFLRRYPWLFGARLAFAGRAGCIWARSRVWGPAAT